MHYFIFQLWRPRESWNIFVARNLSEFPVNLSTLHTPRFRKSWSWTCYKAVWSWRFTSPSIYSNGLWVKRILTGSGARQAPGTPRRGWTVGCKAVYYPLCVDQGVLLWYWYVFRYFNWSLNKRLSSNIGFVIFYERIKIDALVKSPKICMDG